MNYDFLKAIDEKQAVLDATADYLWENPELAFTEFKSAAYLVQRLREEGFTVEENLAGIDTAFSGSYGSGRPIIGILGEFDALSGLSQEAGDVVPQSAGKPCGHGCGHNLLGTGSLAAAIAVKRFLEESGTSGTVIYFGCPAEEGGSGKAFMAREGVFDSLDAAVTWHPADRTTVRNQRNLANYQVLFKFDGIASHAAGAPEMGRSALDAVELMDVGVNYLREHIIQEARIHYAITNSGGISPNVVQPHAEVLYLIRAPWNWQLKDIYARVIKIGQGAALMTETTFSYDFIKACSNLVPNDTMQRVMYDHLQKVPLPEISDEDLAYARALTATLTTSPDANPERPLQPECRLYNEAEEQAYGSSDVGDVSWICPTAQIYASTGIIGTPGHSWQMTAQGKTDYAHNMTRYAGKIMAATAVSLLTDSELLERAKAEHKRRVGKGYECPIPKNIMPRPMSSFMK